MNEIDTNKIKQMTNNLIAFENYEKERKLKKKKMKNMAFAFLALFVIVGGTITVDAATDNKISNAIKDMITVKVDGQDKNATCEKLDNGNIKCSLDEKSTNGEDISFEYDGNLIKKPEVSYDHKPEGDEFSMTIYNEINE